MNIRIGAHVEASDGRAGDVSRIVVEAGTRRLTHIVVKDSRFFGTERLVPIEDVSDATSDKISLRVNHAQFLLLPPYAHTVEYTPETPDTFMGNVARRGFELDQSGVAENAAAFKGGERVEATDGAVGKVDEVIVDPSTSGITHIVLREGHMWSKRHITIPIEQVDYAAREVVYLKVDKAEMESMATPADA
jgi:uncharacterized protein YrrD